MVIEDRVISPLSLCLSLSLDLQETKNIENSEQPIYHPKRKYERTNVDAALDDFLLFHNDRPHLDLIAIYTETLIVVSSEKRNR